jgi:hypothetical protein
MLKARMLRKSVNAHRALDQRKRFLVFGAALAFGIAGAIALLMVGCGGGNPAAVFLLLQHRRCNRCRSQT